MLTYLKFWEINVIAPLFMTRIFRIFIIIVIKMSFIARLNQKHLAQKSVTEESLAVINFERVCFEVNFTKR